MAHLIPRQTQSGGYTDAYAGCTSYDYTAVDNCIYQGIGTAYPSCYDYYSNDACCNSWLGWENSYFSCLQTAYDNCFDFLSYGSSVSAFLPCYTNDPFAGPQSAAAQTTEAFSVPALSLEAVSTGPPTALPTHSSVPTYNGQGNLLQGYCTTPDYQLLDGPTAYWAPIVGCVNQKSDCCPYSVQAATETIATTVIVVATVTVNVDPNGSTQGVYAGLSAYPTPVSSNVATLQHCPGDYVTVSGGCCPSGYQLWNAPLGGEVPCYSSLDSLLVPPAVPVSQYAQQATLPGNVTAAATSDAPTVEASAKATSAVVNVVFAVKFPVAPSTGLSTGAKAGIGVGAGLGGLLVIVLAFVLIWRRKHKKDKKPLTAMQQTEGQAANGQVQNGMTEATPSPYAYSQRTDIQTDGGPQLVQTPGGFVPQEQTGYFQQPGQPGSTAQYYGQQPGQPMQPGLAPTFYPQQPGQPMQQAYGQQPAPAQYPSPVSSSISPQPTGSDGYGQQTGYAGTPPPQPGVYGQQTGYAAPVHELSPNSTGYSAPGSATFVSPTNTGSPAPGQTPGYQGGYNPGGNDANHPPAQELHGQNPPGEMHG